jgi:transposase InsO family protein
MLPASEQARICAARRRSGWGPRLIAGETGHAHATVWRTLRRAGLSRLPRAPREAPRRYEWPCPGDLLHVDSKHFSRFTRPGHTVTGVRDRTGAEKRMRVGHEFVHSLVDDHSRLAYSELQRDERAVTVVGFIERGLAFFAEHGIQARRLMSDNAWAYTHSRALRELLAAQGIRHLLIEKRRPQTNGKVERFQQTLKRSATSTAPPSIGQPRRHTGSSTTTCADPTARSAAYRRSVAFTTSRGRTPRRHQAAVQLDSRRGTSRSAGPTSASLRHGRRLSVDQTCRLQRRSLYAYLADALIAKARDDPAPSLMGA